MRATTSLITPSWPSGWQWPSLVATTDLRGAIGFSSFGVLIYYAIANASAATQPAEDRRWPRALNGAGLIGCLVLVATLPLAAIITGLVDVRGRPRRASSSCGPGRPTAAA